MLLNQDRNAIEARSEILEAVFAANGMASLSQEGKARILNASSEVVRNDNSKCQAKLYFINDDVVIDYFQSNRLVRTELVDASSVQAKAQAFRFASMKLDAIRQAA